MPVLMLGGDPVTVCNCGERDTSVGERDAKLPPIDESADFSIFSELRRFWRFRAGTSGEAGFSFCCTLTSVRWRGFVLSSAERSVQV